jgi:thioredoxin 1
MAAEFIELNDSNFSETLKDVPVAIVDYFASWCGACRMAAPMFKRVAAEFNIPIYKIDAELNPGSRTGVTLASLPTLAVFRNGVPVGSVTTAKEEGLKEFLKQHGIG